MSEPVVVPIRRLREAFVLAAVKPKLFQLLRTFFAKFELVEGDVPTACATMRGEQRQIIMGRKYWVETVCRVAAKLGVDPIECGVDLLFHESWHHLWRHLEDGEKYLSEGYTHREVNLGMDSIINAGIHRIGRCRFFEGWYDDKAPLAFLRPNSRILTACEERSYHRWVHWGRRSDNPKSTATDEDLMYFYGCREVNDDLRQRHAAHCAFYAQLQLGQVTLKEAIEFFHKEQFEKQQDEQFAGSHSLGEGEGEQQQMPQPTEPREMIPAELTESQRKVRGQDVPGQKGQLDVPFFSRDEAKRVLEALGLLNPKAKNNFERIANQITTCVQSSGDVLAGVEVLHRLPPRLGRNDLSTMVRGGRYFEHDEYMLKQVTVFVDLSGSMDEYVPFIIALMRKMKSADLRFEVIVWADRPVKVSFEDFIKGNLPRKEIGGGTAGEPVAAYIRKHNITQSVLITDNLLGDKIKTKIHAQLHVCLTDGGKKADGFLDKNVAPRSRSYQLSLRQR